MDSASRFNSTAVGIICGIGAALFWAMAFAGVRHGLTVGFTPLDLMIHRYLWSGIAFLPLVARGGMRDLNGIGWGRGILLAILGGPCFVLISNAGFLLVPLGHGGVIQPSCATLGGLLMATIWLGEKMTATRAIGALIIVSGLLAIGAESAIAIGIHGVAGDLIFVLTGLMFAAFGILLRLWRISAVPATMVSAGLEGNLAAGRFAGCPGWSAVVYLFAESVHLLGAGRAAVFPSLVPPFVLLVGWAPTALQLAGVILVFFGFRLAQSTPRRYQA
ncbi:MAG: DMT family transporter [Pseudolabrys sp.]